MNPSAEDYHPSHPPVIKQELENGPCRYRLVQPGRQPGCQNVRPPLVLEEMERDAMGQPSWRQVNPRERADILLRMLAQA